jgi:CIC family chloride channel protein
MLLAKPLSAAIAIGTGGPFGAEGPIIATGASLGSLFGQLTNTLPRERKTLVCVGASSGMAAIFGTPLSAILISVELLLSEYRVDSLISIGIGSFVAVSKRK